MDYLAIASIIIAVVTVILQCIVLARVAGAKKQVLSALEAMQLPRPRDNRDQRPHDRNSERNFDRDRNRDQRPPFRGQPQPAQSQPPQQQPQQPVQPPAETVDRSLRDINLRLKNAEQNQERARKQIRDMGVEQPGGPRNGDRPRGDRDRGNDRPRGDRDRDRGGDRPRGDRDRSRNEFRRRDGRPPYGGPQGQGGPQPRQPEEGSPESSVPVQTPVMSEPVQPPQQSAPPSPVVEAVTIGGDIQHGRVSVRHRPPEPDAGSQPAGDQQGSGTAPAEESKRSEEPAVAPAFEPGQQVTFGRR